jgi:predicted GNAT family N-acyltransferase
LQGQGIGSQLVLFTDNYAKEKGYKLIHCNARKTAVPFYLKQGYKILGDEFLEVNIPHYYMEKIL